MAKASLTIVRQYALEWVTSPICAEEATMNAHAEIAGLLDKLRKLPTDPFIHRAIETVSDDIETISKAFGFEPVIDSVWKPLGLASTESKIADMLAARMGKRLTREAIFQRLYGHRLECDQPDPRVVDTFMSRIRRRLLNSPYEIPRETRDARGWMMRLRPSPTLAALGSLAA